MWRTKEWRNEEELIAYVCALGFAIKTEDMGLLPISQVKRDHHQSPFYLLSSASVK